MRNLLIAIVLLLTGGVFYSALWHKSEVIEDDITNRVTDAINEDGASDIAIDVDGRHVTLSGVVFDEQQEQSYLQTADRTYGALGPIDGLTYQADTGYVTAEKSADGITLRGTVPNEAQRASLVEQAQAATDGEVVDNLTIAGPDAPWQQEAGFGLTQLGTLTTGTLTASAGAVSLSGLTDGDANAVNAAVADRDGWTSFVSGPTDTGAADDEVAALRGQIAERDARIGRMNGQLASRIGTIGALTSQLAERDSANGSLNGQLASRIGSVGGLRSQVAENESTIGSLNGQLASRIGTVGALRSQIAERDITIDALRSDLDAAGGADEQVTALRSDLADRDRRIGSLNGQLASRIGTAGALNGQVTDRDSRIGNLNGQLASRIGTIGELNQQITDRDRRIGSLNGQLASRIGTIGALNERVADLESANGRLNGQLATRIGTIGELNQQITDRDRRIGSLNGQLASRIGTIGTLNNDLADRDRRIGNLNGQLASRIGTNGALNQQITDRDRTNGDLNGQLAARIGTVGSLRNQLADRERVIGSLNGQLASRIGTIGTLNSQLAERDETIASLQAQPAAVQTGGLDAQQCARQATSVLEGSRINFATSTANIEAGSVPLLERLTGIALACVGEGLTVEIGGHTDSRGSDDDNQALSEARAQAVVAFMADRGVPTDGLRAVGYGESQPIADNDTDAGQAANRRISFDWQAQ